jgi:hypothetical protein
MHYILFMILLITPPGQSIPKSKRVYNLQTTQAIEFDTQDACIAAHDEIKSSIEITDTIALVSSCLPKGGQPAAALTDKKFEQQPAEKDLQGQSTEKRLEAPGTNRVIRFKTF